MERPLLNARRTAGVAQSILRASSSKPVIRRNRQTKGSSASGVAGFEPTAEGLLAEDAELSEALSTHEIIRLVGAQFEPLVRL